MEYQRSSALFAEAAHYIPGGVNSPVRAFKAVGGTPLFIKEARGAYLYDEDGNRYIDYIASWGPLLFGHAYPPVLNALIEKAKKGTSFGAPTEIETTLARLAISMVPGIDKIRFVNSGTEACMSAVRLARGYTGKEKIIKFSGCYHGHFDAFLIEAGSGAATLGIPGSPGVTNGTAQDTLLAPYNNITSVQALFERYGDNIAAVILEPVAGNMGCIPPATGFLEELRALCNAYNTLLIFDEVMTGFRLARGGAQEVYAISADLVTFGKVIGGGLPVGAFAGRNEIMSWLAPEGPVYQAGTLSGNPLAMSAGLAMLTELDTHPEVFNSLAQKTAYLHAGMDKIASKRGIPYTINRVGSMVSFHFTPEPVTDFPSAARGNNELFKKFFHGMLAESVYLPPSPFESWFLNDAITYDDLDATLGAFERVLNRLQ
jgi:glutamate-1-semialdehyde 2,1-aminomutase